MLLNDGAGLSFDLGIDMLADGIAVSPNAQLETAGPPFLVSAQKSQRRRIEVQRSHALRPVESVIRPNKCP